MQTIKNPKLAASVCAILRKNRTNKYDEYPVIIRVTLNRKVAIMTTRYVSLKFQWDRKNSLPNDKHPEQLDMKNKIAEIKSALKSAEDSLRETNPAYTVKDIVDRYRLKKSQNNSSGSVEPLSESEKKSITVQEYYTTLMRRMEMKGQYSTRDSYVYAFSWLNKFRDIGTLRVTDINKLFLEELLVFMISEKGKEKNGTGEFSQSTLFGNFKNYKAFMSKAIEDEIIDEYSSNFKKFKLAQFKPRKNPRPIPIEQIEKIRELELKPYTRIWNSRNYLIFSFLGNGINFVDLANLQYSNIADGRVRYIRSKTGETCVFKLNQVSQEIINSYNGLANGDFVFPILLKADSKRESYTRIKNERGNMNKDLKKIQKKCGIATNLTYYTSRHSCASLMKSLGLSDDIIGESYGHKSLRSIKHYLKSLSTESSDKVSDKVFQSLNHTESQTNQQVFNPDNSKSRAGFLPSKNIKKTVKRK